jgi:hypothetical protein
MRIEQFSSLKRNILNAKRPQPSAPAHPERKPNSCTLTGIVREGFCFHRGDEGLQWTIRNRKGHLVRMGPYHRTWKSARMQFDFAPVRMYGVKMGVLKPTV